MTHLVWYEILIVVVFASACAMAGALTLIQKIVFICREELRYGLPENQARLTSGVLGGLAGFGVAALGIYYTLYIALPESWIRVGGPLCRTRSSWPPRPRTFPSSCISGGGFALKQEAPEFDPVRLGVAHAALCSVRLA